MKPKIILVKNFDHAIIALLAILLLATIYAAFIAKEKKVEALSSEIASYDQTIQSKLKRTDTPDLESDNYFDDLIGRVKHLPVISPFPTNRNPFYPMDYIRLTPGSLIFRRFFQLPPVSLLNWAELYQMWR